MTENEPHRLTKNTIHNRSIQESLRKLQVEYLVTGYREIQEKIKLLKNLKNSSSEENK